MNLRMRWPLLLAGLASLSCSDGSGPPSPTATRLAFTSEPTDAVADTAIPATIRVSVLDQNGAVLTTAASSVSLTLGANPSGATLSGTTTVNPAAGVATFTAITLDKVGTGYTLVATSAGLTPDTSAGFDVTLSLQDSDGDTFSPNEGDCNDANAAIHPGATDMPDPAFVDTDCDQIDGERDNATFVATTGTDGPTCGAEAGPCATVQQGISRAVALGKRDVYVAQGTYTNGSFALANGVNVFGGFSAQYARGPGNIVTISGRADFPIDGQAQAITVLAEGLTISTTLADLTLVGANSAGTTSGGQGKSAYVIFARNLASGSLTIARNTIVAGNGFAGLPGGNGANAVTVSRANGGQAGGDAGALAAVCDTSNHGLGGAAAAVSGSGGTGSTAAGQGGNGGEIDTFCDPVPFPVDDSDLTATAGDGGGNAGQVGLSTGHGGGGGGGGNVCGRPQDGEDGSVTNGSGGPGAGSGGRFVGDFWYAKDGDDGAVGSNGGGGGGGGGSGGCDTGADSYGAGGGGGGEGGRAAQSGGTGGKGGGGSFAIFLIDASPLIESNTITRGDGGTGGAGGIGGQGQSGGLGALGGLAADDSQAGGSGGDGGHGGHGGGGGGGSGGSSLGVYSVGTGTPTLTGNAIAGGNAGAAGQGGASAPNAPAAERDGNSGTNGASGTLGTTGVCASRAGC